MGYYMKFTTVSCEKKYILIRLLICLYTGLLFAQTDNYADQQQPEIFMWVGANRLMQEDPTVLEDMLLFARRFDIIPYSSGMSHPDQLSNFLKTCKSLGISRTWIEIGPGKEVTLSEFIENKEAREPILKRFQKLAAVYRRYYPEYARITLFDEAPLGAFRPRQNNLKSYIKEAEIFRTLGPKAFSWLYQALKSEMPEAEVGVFLHHPHNASPTMAGEYSFIASFISDADSLGTVPDFIFSDVYRGYFNRGYGLEATNQYITDVVAHTRQVADQYNIRAYQLGQMHTIKLGYTPGRREIDTNIDAMLRGNPHGIGWYWPNYAATDRVRNKKYPGGKPAEVDVSFDSFVPNSWGTIGPAGSVWGTSRDRFIYSYLRMLETIGRIQDKDCFDLWLYGYDFDHGEHRIYIHATGDSKKNWEYLGSVNPQQDMDQYEDGADTSTVYSYNGKWHAVVFHALSRSRFFNFSSDTMTVTVKIITPEGSDGSELAAVYVMPYRATRHYGIEEQIRNWIKNYPRWITVNSLAYQVYPEPITLRSDSEPVIVHTW
ncbi:MAG: hypothetical protein R6V04_13925 [bacterium]